MAPHPTIFGEKEYFHSLYRLGAPWYRWISRR